MIQWLVISRSSPLTPRIASVMKDEQGRPFIVVREYVAIPTLIESVDTVPRTCG